MHLAQVSYHESGCLAPLRRSGAEGRRAGRRDFRSAAPRIAKSCAGSGKRWRHGRDMARKNNPATEAA